MNEAKMIPLETVEEGTPVGTAVVLIKDDGRAFLTKTRSIAWELGGGHLVVKVEGVTGGYLASRCHILLPPPAEA